METGISIRQLKTLIKTVIYPKQIHRHKMTLFQAHVLYQRFQYQKRGGCTQVFPIIGNKLYKLRKVQIRELYMVIYPNEKLLEY